MTREEAIIILKNTASLLRDGTRYMKPEHEKQFREAYEMAIKALKQPEPCEDAVSREMVSEWLKQYGQDVLHGKYKFSLMYIWKNLMDLPSVQPEQRWIPVTDHLPDEDVPVLVTDDAGGMATVCIDSCGRYEDTGERFWYTSQNVTAWMYTVEPYGGK